MSDLLIPEIVDSSTELIPSVPPVHVAVIASPFSFDRVKFDVAAGGSVADILAALGLPRTIPARIFLDDREVAPSERENAIPRAGAALAIRVFPQGQGGGGKAVGMLMDIAAIALMATGYGALLGVVLLATEPLVVGALTPSTGQYGVHLTRPPAFTISGGQNIAAPLAPIPKIYGQRLLSPMLAASTYVEQVGEDQFLRMLFVLGYGPLDINTVQIKNSAIEGFKSLQWEWRAGFPDDEPTVLYPGSVVTQALNIQLCQSRTGVPPTLYGWQQQTSGEGADELAVWISWPGGLNAYGNGNGVPIPIQVNIHIQWRLTGSSNPWTVEPRVVAHKGSPGNTSIAYSWKVPRGQYDVQVQVTRVIIFKNDWLNPYECSAYWTELDTIRDQPPVTMAGLSLLAIRIRASGQLNGVINQMNMIASSILPDYNPATGLWNDRAGAWTYDYDNQGAGASGYNLDAADAHTPTAVTGKNWLPDQALTPVSNGVATSFSGTLAFPVQPSSVIVSVGTAADAVSGRGTKKKRANVSVLPFIMDDGNGGINGPTIAAGSTINYATGAIVVNFTTPPATGNPVTVDSVQLVTTPGAGRCVTIATLAATDGASIASQPIPALQNLQPEETPELPTPGTWTISGWYKASAAIAAGIRITAYFGMTMDFNVGDAGVKYVDIISNGPATTGWQQFSAQVTAPGGALLYLRVAAYHNPDGVGGVTVYFDDFSVKGAFSAGSLGPTQVEILPNPSFDFHGSITSNPASIYRDILQGPANKLALADSRIDLAALQSWWQNNNSQGHFFNGLFDRKGTVFDALKQVAALGRAAFSISDGLYSVVQDQPQTTPVQHFTPRNSWGFKSTRAFPILPQALNVRWINPANNWGPDQYLVFDDKPGGGTYDQTSVNLYQGLDLTQGVTSMTQAWQEGRYRLAQARLEPEMYQLNVDFENLVCTRGDMVLVSHDVPSIGMGAGRIKAQIFDPAGAGNLLGVILDESSFNFEAGTNYVMRVRLESGASMLIPINNPAPAGSSIQTDTMMLATAIPAGSTMPLVDDLAMIGVLGSETAQMLVVRVEPQKDLTAILTLCDYNPAVYTADANPPIGDSQGYPAPPPFPPVIESVLSGDGSSQHHSDGAIPGEMLIHLEPIPTMLTTAGAPIGILYRSRVDAANDYVNCGIYSATTNYMTSDMVTDTTGQQWVCVTDNTIGVTPGTDNGADWEYIVDNSPWIVSARIALTQTVKIVGLQVGTQTDVQLCYVYQDGSISTWTDIASAVNGQMTLPNDPSNLQAKITHKADVKLWWSAPNPKMPNFKAYEIRTGSSFAAGTYLDQTKKLNYVVVDPTPGATTYWVAAMDSAGNYDATPPYVTFTVPSPGSVTGLTARITHKADLRLSWTAPATLPTGFSAYEIRTGASWATGTLLDRTKKTFYVITDPAPGATTYWVGVLDRAGNYDANPPSVTNGATAPGDVTNLAASITHKADLKLSWTRPAILPTGFSAYEIRTGASWAAGTVLDRTKKTFYVIPDPPAGSTTYWVGVLDRAGNYDANPPSVTSAVNTGVNAIPDVTSLAAQVTHKSDIKLSWTKPSTIPAGFDSYEIRTDTNWGNPTNLVDRTKKNSYLIVDPSPGSTTYWVGVLDKAGHYDATPPSVTATLGAPDDVTGLTATVTSHNDLILKWTKPAALPTGFEAYEIRVGGQFISTATESGNIATITTSAAHGLSVGEVINVTGVSVAGYNGNGGVVLSVPTSTTFTYQTASSGLPAGTGGAVVGWASSVLVDRTKKTNYLITDPPNTEDFYMVGVLDKAGNYDPVPASVLWSFTQQPYTVKTLLAADVGPFTSPTTIIGPIDFVIPPSGGRLHVDWTMILTNGATTQAVRGYVYDATTPLSCAQHRTRCAASQTSGFNASGHFDRLYPGGATISLSLMCVPVAGDNVTVNASDITGGSGGAGSDQPSVTFLDVQFHPSPN